MPLVLSTPLKHFLKCLLDEPMMNFRELRIFFQAKSKDYEEASCGCDRPIENDGENAENLYNRTIIKRLEKDLQGALEDFNSEPSSGAPSSPRNDS